ncbi:hypothetical protein N802_10500 [Knoellia sinensis KCTC 19936]|uniref:Uncharacterized protein n=1 Tax=Knoellia sinensis KCTC 19936 TaxID=1385520 RepID=A0A0A0J0Y7_9MICO|nr:hypothetical protein N802_10500 [Knoellia sinensis KCTC 19936]
MAGVVEPGVADTRGLENLLPVAPVATRVQGISDLVWENQIVVLAPGRPRGESFLRLRQAMPSKLID